MGKIVSIIITFIFIFSSIGYPLQGNVYAKACLRIPLITTERVDGGLRRAEHRQSNNQTEKLKKLIEQIWPNDGVEKIAIQIAGKTWTTLRGPHYLMVENFLFLKQEDWQEHKEQLEDYQDFIIICELRHGFVWRNILDFYYGIHTILAVTLLQAYASILPNQTVLDAGSGDGVLGMVASRLGAKRVVCIEQDKEWVQKSAKFVQLNRIKNVKIIEADFGHIAKFEQTKDITVVLASLKSNGLYKAFLEGKEDSDKRGDYYNWHMFLAKNLNPEWYFIFGALGEIDQEYDMASIVRDAMIEMGWKTILEHRLEGYIKRIPTAFIMKHNENDGLPIDEATQRALQVNI